MEIAIIDQQTFTSLKKGDELKKFTIKIANCGGLGKYPTHIVSCKRDNIEFSETIFHDGKNIRYVDENHPHNDSILVGELNTKRPSISKPILKEEDSVEITVDLQWLVEFASAIDRTSYSCGGMCIHTNGHKAIYDETLKLVQMDVEGLKKVSK